MAAANRKSQQVRLHLVSAAAIFTLFFPSPASSKAWAQDDTANAAPCSSYQLVKEHPLSALPTSVQAKLRQAVTPALHTIINDPGMGMTDTKLESVPLNALEIARPSKTSTLYIVAWDDPQFGVNGYNGIVELTPHGAASLLSARDSQLASGFGVEVLAQANHGYPEVMIASKGFKEGGGAEAEDGCFHKVGSVYESTSCPATCHHNLNSQ